MILLEVDNVNLSFDGIRAIRELDFKVNKNQIAGIIGATECGKTTLFDLISGVYIPDSGKIFFDGHDITAFSIEKLNSIGIARTFQNGNVFQNLTVFDNIRVGYYNSLSYNLSDVILRDEKFFRQEKELCERANELLDIFELLDYTSELAKNIPYDLQCKLDIARAIATSPKLLLLDRPTSGMNNIQSEEFMTTIEMVNRRFNTAIVVIENDINLIMNICSEISVMEYGTIIATGSPIEIKNNQALTSICLGE